MGSSCCYCKPSKEAEISMDPKSEEKLNKEQKSPQLTSREKSITVAPVNNDLIIEDEKNDHNTESDITDKMQESVSDFYNSKKQMKKKCKSSITCVKVLGKQLKWDKRYEYVYEYQIDGAVYSGQINEKKLFSGYGYLNSIEISYQGEFKKNKFHGLGVYQKKNEEFTYEGYFKNGKFHGHGTLTTSKSKYIGAFEGGVKDGQGKEYYSNNDFYEGEYVNDKKEGFGRMNFADSKYEGYFKNDVFDGKGLLESVSGDNYEGEFKNGLKEGKGVLISKNLKKYEGNWITGKLHGNTTITDPDGRVRISIFDMGKVTR